MHRHLYSSELSLTLIIHVHLPSCLPLADAIIGVGFSKRSFFTHPVRSRTYKGFTGPIITLELPGQSGRDVCKLLNRNNCCMVACWRQNPRFSSICCPGCLAISGPFLTKWVALYLLVIGAIRNWKKNHDLMVQIFSWQGDKCRVIKFVKDEYKFNVPPVTFHRKNACDHRLQGLEKDRGSDKTFYV